MINKKILFFFLYFPLILFFNSNASIAAKLSCPNPSGSANGGSSGQFGPYDYRYPANRTGPSNPLYLVEMAHFTPNVAMLIAGNSGYLGGDIDYTLRAFPNHHRALQSLADLALRDKQSNIPHMSYSVPCFFIRAKNFAPSDGMVNAVYAYYLANINQKDLALSEAEQAINKAETTKNPRIYYEVGLAYYYLGDYKKSLECSEQAKKLGSTAVGLETLLSQVVQRNNLKK